PGTCNHAGDEDAEVLAIVIAGMVILHLHWMIGDAHTNIAEIDLMVRGGLCELRQQVVFIGKAHPLASRVPHMDMRTAAQGPGRERWREITRIKIHRLRGGHAPVYGHDDTLTMKRPVLPVRCRVLRAKDEHHLPFTRMKCSDTTVRSIFCAIQLP